MDYRIEWIWLFVPIGALALATAPFVGAVLAVLALLIFAVAILVALVAAIVATPFLVAHAVHRHWRSGRVLPANVAQAKVRKASPLTGAGEQSTVREAPLPAPVR